MDIGEILQATFARNVILLALFVQAQAALNVPLAKQDIFYNHRPQHALILVQMGIGEILQANLAVSAILIVQFAQVQILINVLLVIQGTFCNQHRRKQHVLILVQVDIGRTLQTTFAQNAMLLVQSARMGTILNVLPAIQDTFCNHRRRQYALTLVQKGIGETLQIIFALLATLLAQFVQVQIVINVPPANRDIFFNRHQHLASTLVLHPDIGKMP